MSASNWASCPRCWRRAEVEKVNLRKKATEAYGVLPVEEFEKLRELANAEIDITRATFREDYEVYGAAEGYVEIAYRGGCTVCGLKLAFGDVREIEGWRD